jgi:PAB1-binding protein PBP1
MPFKPLSSYLYHDPIFNGAPPEKHAKTKKKVRDKQMEEREQRIKEIKKMVKNIKHHCYVITQDIVMLEESFDDSSIRYIHDMLCNIEKQLDLYQQKVQQSCKKNMDMILQDGVDVNQIDLDRSIKL